MTRRTVERGLKPVGLNWRRSLLIVFQVLRESGLLKDSIVVLTGSYAQGSETPRSDIDVLVVRHNRSKGIRAPYGVHFKFEDLKNFRKRLAEGDDFIIDALKFGKLLHDALGLWEVMQEEMKNAKWPDWRDKIGQARRRIRLAEQLLKLGDFDAAEEEFLLTATQIARARLLRHGIFPMSRPQLSDQLLTIGEADLASELEELSEGTSGEAEIRTIGRKLRSALDEPRADANSAFD